MTSPESSQTSDPIEPPAEQLEWLVDPEYPYTDHRPEIMTEYTEDGCPREEVNVRQHYEES